MNAQLTNAGQQANWPLPVQGDYFPNLSFTANTQAQPNNYSAYASASVCGVTFSMTAQNWPAGEHWLQIVYTNYSVDSVPAGSTVEDPHGHGFWLVDNNNSPGKPFYDIAFPNGGPPPNFYDLAKGPWNGISFFQAYLFVADMDPNTNVITLHDMVFWGWGEPRADPTPEPSSVILALIGSGTLGLLSYTRRRKTTC